MKNMDTKNAVIKAGKLLLNDGAEKETITKFVEKVLGQEDNDCLSEIFKEEAFDGSTVLLTITSQLTAYDELFPNQYISREGGIVDSEEEEAVSLREFHEIYSELFSSDVFKAVSLQDYASTLKEFENCYSTVWDECFGE